LLPRRWDRGHLWIEYFENGELHSAGLFQPDNDNCWLPRLDFCWWGRARVNACNPGQPLQNDKHHGKGRVNGVGSLPIRMKEGVDKSCDEVLNSLKARINHYHKNPPVFFLPGRFFGKNCRAWARMVLDECGIELASEEIVQYTD